MIELAIKTMIFVIAWIAVGIYLSKTAIQWYETRVELQLAAHNPHRFIQISMDATKPYRITITIDMTTLAIASFLSWWAFG